MGNVNGQDQKIRIAPGLLEGGKVGGCSNLRNISETFPESRDKDVTFTKDRKLSHVIQYS